MQCFKNFDSHTFHHFDHPADSTKDYLHPGKLYFWNEQPVIKGKQIIYLCKHYYTLLIYILVNTNIQYNIYIIQINYISKMGRTMLEIFLAAVILLSFK